ncbi:MAG: histidine triad nucleotide-binding protein [Patescibacteria group bacterium]|jgi:histidine triad (HIT) family protein
MPDQTENCVFCNIISGKNPAQIEYQDTAIIAFTDIEPAAPFHLLVVPKKHIGSIDQVQSTDQEILGKLVITAKEIAHRSNLDEEGYRIVINNGHNGGQKVEHLHLHLLAGTELGPMTSAKPNPISQFG